MLDSIRRGQKWLTVIFIIIIGGVFVFFLGLGGPLSRQSGPSGNAVVQLDDLRLEVSDFQRQRAIQEERLRDAMGENFDARTARSFLDSQTLSSMVSGAILADSAAQLGLRASKAEIQRVLRDDPSLRDESGRFDRDAFEATVEYNFGSQRNFLRVMRQDLLRQKMLHLLYAQADVSESEARAAALQSLEEVRIAYVSLDTAKLPADAELDAEAVDGYLAEHEDELRTLYDARIEEFQVPEKASARHILIQLGRDADPEAVAAASARAEELRGRIQSGASFEDVALEASDDPGSRDSGGDLGTFARGELGPELEEAAFSLEPGELSAVFRSDNGFHILRLQERFEAGERSFDEVGRELAEAEYGRSYARDHARALADSLSEAVRGGQSLEDAAREADLTLQRTAMIPRRVDGFIPGLGASPQMLATVFALEEESPSSPEVFSVDNLLVLAQLLERNLPDEEDLQELVQTRRKQLLEAERSRIIDEWIERRRSQLVEQGRLQVNAEIVTRS